MFDGVQEMGLPPPKVIVAEIFRGAKWKVQWLASGKCVTKEDLDKRNGIKRVSIYFN